MATDAGLKVLQLENTAQIVQSVRDKTNGYDSDSSKESAAAERIPKIR